MVEISDTVESNKQLVRSLMGSAVSFYLAAKKISEADWRDHAGRPVAPWPPFFANIAYSIELSLKAFIAYRGGEKSELKKIGHDLRQALKRSQALGLTDVSDAIVSLIEKLTKNHNDRNFFYLDQINMKTLPALEDALAEIADLLSLVARQTAI